MAKELNMLNKSLQENLDLTAYSQAGHTHKYAGSDTVGGAASTAVKLHTARTINGTSFDGSGNITTANWGTARNITIGSSSKSVNGSGNVGWTLAEIGAAPTVHNHTFIESIDTRSTNPAPNTYTSRGITPEFKSASGIGLPNVGKNFAGVLTYQQWSDTSAWSGGKTTQFATIDDGRMYYRKGDGSGWGSWYQFYTTQNKPTYSDVGAAAASHGTHVTYATATPSANGTAAVGSSAKVAREDHVHPLQTTISGAAGSAGKWTTARTLTIGNSGKSVDGSANVTWTLAEIGALPLSGGTMTGAITTPNNAQGIKVGDDAVICDRNIANHIVIEGATATSGGITFGSGKDTNIYRGGANLLKTDDTFNAVGGLQWNGESLDTRYAKASHGSHISFSTTTPKVAGTAAIGSDSGAARGDHVHPAQTSVSGNAGTATKLQTARTIALGTGVTSTATSFDGSKNITIPVTGVKEAYLEWGGRNFTGDYGPIDAAMVPHLGANRLAFMPAAGVAFEYSRDGGSTWTAYSTSNANKINFFNGNGADHFIGADSSTKKDKAKYMFRVTITASTAKVYTVLNKFVIYCSTNGSTGSYCSIDARTQANVTAGTNTWVNFANKVSISGWSGYNVINTSGITVGTNSTQYGQLRFTFGVTSHANTVEYPGLSVSMVMGFGGVGWGTPSTMAAKGRIYNYDENQNVTFPAQVTATQFNGPLNGNASTATKWSSARTLTIGNSGKTYDGSGNQSYSLSEIGALPTAGGTMTGNIKFTDVTSTTYPAKSAMLTWNGSTDGADIYYQVDASDKGRLVLNTRDDADCIIMFANNGASKATIDNSGNFSGKAAKAGNADTATKLATGRSITIGNQAQTFDGTGNIAFSVASIGAAASSHSHNTLPIKGTDTITSTTNDTTAKWGAQGTSVHWYTQTGQLIDQPNQWGYLLNVGQSSEVHQLWMTQASGDLKHRGGNDSGWSGTWRTILDTSNYKTHVTPANIGAAASSHGTHVTYSTTTPLVAGTASVGSANNVSRGDHVHPPQTSVSGNAGTATKLATARTLTIGNKGKTFDGSGNQSWSLAEIGAAAEGHTHSSVASANVLNQNTRMDYGWNGLNYFNISGTAGNAAKINDTPTTAWWHIIRCNHANSAGFYTDIAVPFNATSMYYKRIASGSVQNGGWVKMLDALNFNEYAAAKSHGTHVDYATATPKAHGTAAVGTSAKVAREDHVHPAQTSVSGNAGTATKLQNAKSITIGNKANTFDGSANISYTLAEIGAAATSHTHNQINSRGNVTCESGVAGRPAVSGLSMSQAYNNGYPTTYGNVISLKGTGDGQILVGWSGTDGAHAPVYVRSKRDNTSTANWSGWAQFYTTAHKPTPADIGAAASSHGIHVTYATATPKANGTAAIGSVDRVAREDHVHPLQTSVSGNAGTATKLQTARTITIGNKSNTFDGNANISYTLADIGAATSGHTHNYAGSSSAGGAANSAVKLSSARTINGTNFDGTANITTANWGTARKINQISVNGSADVKLPLDYYTCSIGSSNAKPYHHILATGQCTGSYTDKSITIVITQHYNGGGLGIARATFRTNDTANGATAIGELKWLVRFGFNEDQLCYNLKNTAKDAYMDVFFKCNGTYGSTTWYVLTEGGRGNHSSQWTKYNTNHDNGTNVYNEAGMKAIRTYTSTLVAAVDAGFAERSNNAYYADDAGTAATLKTARNIALGGLLSGSASFNGSANITINASVAKPLKSGDWFSGGIPVVNTDGVMEVGKYIDFHNTDTSTNDYDVRLQANTSTPCVITLPSGGGTLARTSDSITGNAATATKLQTARNIKIGNATKSFNGTANVEFTLAEIGIGNSISAVASNLSGVTINGYDSILSGINTNIGKL